MAKKTYVGNILETPKRRSSLLKKLACELSRFSKLAMVALPLMATQGEDFFLLKSSLFLRSCFQRKLKHREKPKKMLSNCIYRFLPSCALTAAPLK